MFINDNVYLRDYKRDIARFDTSDYPADNVYDMPLANKKILGLMKDENNGVLMTEFVGLRAKMYAVRVDGKKNIKKAKGVKNNIVARTIMFDDYTRCLNEEIEMTRRQYTKCNLDRIHDIRIENRSESKTTTNDTSYRIRRRRYHGDIGGYLCNTIYVLCYYVLLLYFTLFFYIYTSIIFFMYDYYDYCTFI